MKRESISPTEALLRDLLSKRILILDGAMGTMIQQYKLTEEDYRGTRFADFAVPAKELFGKGNNELLTLTQPRIISEIHEKYLAAGADLIETNTFGATSVAQDDYHMAHLVYEMNLQAARLARAACDKYSTPDKPRFVAGALGPTPKTADGVDLTRRQRSCRTQCQFRSTGGRLSGADTRIGRRRLGCAAGRDYLRYAQLQGSAVRH